MNFSYCNYRILPKVGALIFGILILSLAGCMDLFEPEEEVALNVFPDTQAADPEECGEWCSGCPNVGEMYRFDTLAVTKLDGKENPVTEVLNPVWEMDIKLNELNIIFEVIETTDEAITFRAINAARVGTDGETCLMENTAIQMYMSRNRCAMEPLEPAGMNIYAGTQEHPKSCVPSHSIHAIAVQGVELAGCFTGDCGRIVKGEIVNAYLPKDFLDNTCSCITTGTDLSDKCLIPDPDYKPGDACAGCNDGFVALNTYLKAFSPGGKLDYLCETESGNPAVCLSGHFSLTRLEENIAVCP